jgi:hypothetical protein
VDDVAYRRALASEVKRLVCLGQNGRDVLRGVSEGAWPGRLAATGSEAPDLVDYIMSPACPISAELTDFDKGDPLFITQWLVDSAKNAQDSPSGTQSAP